MLFLKEKNPEKTTTKKKTYENKPQTKQPESSIF